MARHAPIGVDNDLAPGKAAVADRTANDELPGGIDENFRLGRQPVAGQGRVDDLFHDRFMQGLGGNVRIMLGG